MSTTYKKILQQIYYILQYQILLSFITIAPHKLAN